MAAAASYVAAALTLISSPIVDGRIISGGRRAQHQRLTASPSSSSCAALLCWLIHGIYWPTAFGTSLLSQGSRRRVKCDGRINGAFGLLGSASSLPGSSPTKTQTSHRFIFRIIFHELKLQRGRQTVTFWSQLPCNRLKVKTNKSSCRGAALRQLGASVKGRARFSCTDPLTRTSSTNKVSMIKYSSSH